MYNIIDMHTIYYKLLSGELTSLCKKIEDMGHLFAVSVCMCTDIDVFQRVDGLLSNIQLFSHICNSLHEELPLRFQAVYLSE